MAGVRVFGGLMCREVEGPHEVKARKSHRCDWCGKRIEVGETYRVAKYVSDGTVYAWHECERCRPYVKEMWESYGNPQNRPKTLTFADFEEHMVEFHPEVWSEWRGGE